MKPIKPTGEIFIPDNTPYKEAMKRTTHLCIAAHHDDIEIMSYQGIADCFQNDTKYFTGVVVTNGSGSARQHIYKDYSDQEMTVVRKKEQKKAAVLGEYSVQFLLDYESKEVKDKDNTQVIDELVSILRDSTPSIVYTHNLADKHDTHIGLSIKTIKAIRKLPKISRPQKLYGCEVWRALDWINDEEKVLLDVSKHPNLSAALVEVFDSQIIGGKRYDLATVGRRLANATFTASHQVDQSNALTYAMDLTPLIQDDQLDINDYVTSYIERFKNDVSLKIKSML